MRHPIVTVLGARRAQRAADTHDAAVRSEASAAATPAPIVPPAGPGVPQLPVVEALAWTSRPGSAAPTVLEVLSHGLASSDLDLAETTPHVLLAGATRRPGPAPSGDLAA